jgi:methylenetetrahydrofolate dehydrogenase (NADP+)/methenyltetrahydrofolate cyclohydrolase
MTILNGKELSLKIKEDLKGKVSLFSRKPGLVVIQVGNDEASVVYVRNKEKTAAEIGIKFIHLHFDNISQENLINEINKLNNDNNIDGVIVQLPLPNHLSEDTIINAIDPNKDVDGLTNINVAKLINDQDSLVPCTPMGIMRLLEHYNINISGKNVVVVGRSRLVGKPISMLMLNKNASVTICHSKTANLSDFTKKADIIIVAVGKPSIIGSKMVKKGVIIVDVGINRINGKLYGDVDYDKVSKKTSYITPVPGGVGPMTVVMLMENVIKSYEKKMS